MKVGAALSTAPEARAAAIEAAQGARKDIGDQAPSLAVVFASPHFSPKADVLLDAVHEAAGPRALIGCVAESVLGGSMEIEGAPAVAVWLAALETDVETFSVEFSGDAEEPVLMGWPEEPSKAFIVVCDPYTFPADLLLGHVNESSPGTVIAGGMASGGSGPGQTVLFLDRRVLRSGAVGARLTGDFDVVTLVSQGCRPVGSVFTVTRAEQNVVYELGGKPAVDRIKELYASLPQEDKQLLAQGLFVGRVIDEYKPEFERGDFLIRGVMGADPESGAIAIGDRVQVGETVQFHVRDAASADEDLRATLERAGERIGGAPAGALLFTCNGRGSRMFSTPSHDAALVTEKLAGAPLAGFFCAGELGPVGGKNFLHGFTASMALLCRKASSGR